MSSRVSRATAVMAKAAACWYQVDEKLPMIILLHRFTGSQMSLQGYNEKQELCATLQMSGALLVAQHGMPFKFMGHLKCQPR